jgi:hypothetical protein
LEEEKANIIRTKLYGEALQFIKGRDHLLGAEETYDELKAAPVEHTV